MHETEFQLDVEHRIVLKNKIAVSGWCHIWLYVFLSIVCVCFVICCMQIQKKCLQPQVPVNCDNEWQWKLYWETVPLLILIILIIFITDLWPFFPNNITLISLQLQKHLMHTHTHKTFKYILLLFFTTVDSEFVTYSQKRSKKLSHFILGGSVIYFFQIAILLLVITLHTAPNNSTQWVKSHP